MSSNKMANLNAILRWSIEHGHKEDAPKDAVSYAEEMSPERREWLKEAIEGMTNYEDVIDIVAKRLQGMEEDGVTPLQLSEADLVAAQETTLEEMLTVIDNIDFAKDFGQIGGADALLSLLQSPHAGLRWRSAEVVATVVQNNPACQAMMLERNILETLMNMVESDENPIARTKAFLGISSQVRAHPPSLESFLKKGGVDIMMQALDGAANSERDEQMLNQALVKKVLFFIPAIVFMRPTFSNVGNASGLLERCIAFSLWGIPNEVEADGEEGKEGKEEEDRGGLLRESALKAAVALATGSGGLTAEAKQRLLERIVDLGKLEGEEKMYAEDELNLLKEVTKAK